MKFKVWHKKNEKFYGVSSIIFDNEGNIDLIRLKETNTFVKADEVEVIIENKFSNLAEKNENAE